MRFAIRALVESHDTGTDLRKLYLIGEVDHEMAKQLIVDLQTLDATEGPIVIVMTSAGGNEGAGYAIFDAIRMTHNPVTILAYGEVMSIAALVLQAADNRLLSPECRFLIHNGSVPSGGDDEGYIDADKLIARAKETIRNNHRYHKLIAHRSGLPLAKIKTFCKQETLFWAEEAVKLGFADGIINVEKEGVWHPKELDQK